MNQVNKLENRNINEQLKYQCDQLKILKARCQKNYTDEELENLKNSPCEMTRAFMKMADNVKKFKYITIEKISDSCKAIDGIVYLPKDNIRFFDYKRKKCDHKDISKIYFPVLNKYLNVCMSCETLIDEKIGLAFFGRSNELYAMLRLSFRPLGNRRGQKTRNEVV